MTTLLIILAAWLACGLLAIPLMLWAEVMEKKVGSLTVEDTFMCLVLGAFALLAGFCFCFKQIQLTYGKKTLLTIGEKPLDKTPTSR